jgi:hypothetical protein
MLFDLLDERSWLHVHRLVRGRLTVLFSMHAGHVVMLVALLRLPNRDGSEK